MTRRRGFVTTRRIIYRVDFAGREDIQFTVHRVASPLGERLAKHVFALRELFGEHLVPESGNDRYAARTTLREILTHIRVIQMLVDICHNYPVGNATTFFPAGLLKRECGTNSGLGIAIWRH